MFYFKTSTEEKIKIRKIDLVNTITTTFKHLTGGKFSSLV